jgi:AbiV family abortive infection protein
MAREELGKHYILRDLWRQAAEHGKQFSAAEVNKQCNSHEAKQRAGQRIVALRGDPNTARLLEAFETHGIDSQEAREAWARVWESSMSRREHVPMERHRARLSAIYVDLKPSGDWHRPFEIGKDEATYALQDAANDYALTRVPLISAIEYRRDPRLASAAEAWPDRPAIPLPSWPD